MSRSRKPRLSRHFQSRTPSSVRAAQIKFYQRKEKVEVVNVAIGNVSLPLHPAVQKRLFNLKFPKSHFNNAVVKYSPSVGEDETRQAFLNIIASSGFRADNLFVQVTSGASQGMELCFLGVADSRDRPVLLIEPVYANYPAMAQRTVRSTVAVKRRLQGNGQFSLPDFKQIEVKAEKSRAAAMVVIPYDNPTGQFYDQETMVKLAKICVRHNMWLISDEAYRELFYTGEQTSSIWGISEKDAPGITGRRISLESASKVWNACGFRIGALVTDSQEFHQKAVAEYTADLGANAVCQYAFGALAELSHAQLKQWYSKQRVYYRKILTEFKNLMEKILPGVIVSRPQAAIYTVVDLRKIVKPGFNSLDFVLFCAAKGKVKYRKKEMTLLAAPMTGFYTGNKKTNPGRTQLRIAFVESPEKMKAVPELLAELLSQYEQTS